MTIPTDAGNAAGSSAVTFIAEPHHPVPAMLVFDQPSKVCFPKRLAQPDDFEVVNWRDEDIVAPQGALFVRRASTIREWPPSGHSSRSRGRGCLGWSAGSSINRRVARQRSRFRRTGCSAFGLGILRLNRVEFGTARCRRWNNPKSGSSIVPAARPQARDLRNRGSATKFPQDRSALS